MNLLILLLFGFFSASQGRYKIPQHDTCVLRVLLCDDFIKPLTPIDNSTLEMFQTITEVNDICDELTKFRACLESAENFCKENSELDVGFQLLNNRRLAFDLCVPGSSLQDEYMMIEGCVNKYSHSVIQFCTDKAVELVGLQFYLGDYDAECRFLGELHHCHIAVVRNLCGSIAGNLLEKLVVFRGERDFLCIDYEKGRQSKLEEFYATMDFYVEQYKNIIKNFETEGKSETTDEPKDYKKPKGFVQDEASSKFQTRISDIADKDGDFGYIYITDIEQPFDSKTFHSTKQQPLDALNFQEKDYTTISPKLKSRFSDHKYNFYASENLKYPIDTKILSVSPDGKLENKFNVGDSEKNLEESFTLTSYKPSKYLQHSYRPDELFRPRLGEALEVEDGPIKDENIMITDAEKDSPTMSFKDTLKEYCSIRRNAEQICPVLQENISVLVDKLAAESKENCLSIADPLDMNESENQENVPIYEKDIPCNYDLRKSGDPEIMIDRPPNDYEETYIVTPSTEIEIHREHNCTTYAISDEPNLVEDSEALDAVEDSEALDAVEDSEALDAVEDSVVIFTENNNKYLVKVTQDSDAIGLTLEKYLIPKSTNPRSSQVDILESMQSHQNNSHQISDNFIDAKASHKLTSEEEISAKSENMFDRSSDNPTDLEEMLLNAFEVLAKLKVHVMRLLKKLRETRMKENDKIHF